MTHRFLFVNTREASCSIYEKGLTFYELMQSSPNWKMDYAEVQFLNRNELHSGRIMGPDGRVPPQYDAIIWNYHPYTMRELEGIDCTQFYKFPGVNYCMVVEEIRDDANPVVDNVSDSFNGYIVLDPTKKFTNPRFHAFPRVLPRIVSGEQINPEIPIIGCYGYVTVDKGFDLIVKAASEEFEKSIVRINLPQASYADQNKSLLNSVLEKCRFAARDNVELQITHHFFSNDELIDWCAQNTVNAFFYQRHILGIAAAPDQAIASGRPIAVSDNPTFRHILQYQKPFPEMSLRETIENGVEYVRQIQAAWSKDACIQRLTEIIFDSDD